MRSFLFIMFTLFLSVPLQAEDMQKYLNETQIIVQQGKYEEALERYIWFHEHALEHDKAMYGVRLSFALSYWKQLGDVYPPAKQALIEIRDRKTLQLQKGEGNVALFHDVTSLNRTLLENNKTIELFEQIDKVNPALAKNCWRIAKDAVIAAGRIDLARKYLGDMAGEFAAVKAMYDRNTALYNNPKIGGERFKKYNENRFVEECLSLIKVAVAIGNLDVAKEIQTKALTVVNDARLRDAIVTNATTVKSI